MYRSIRPRQASGHNLSPSDVQYLRDFSAGQRAFVEQQTELAVERLEMGDATGAIVEGRKITDIPQNYTHKPVVTERLDDEIIRSTPREPAHIINEARRAGAEARRRGEEDSEIRILSRDTNLVVPEIIPQTIAHARLMLYGREATEWALATSRYTDGMSFHSAAISGLELAAAHAPDIPSSQLNDLQVSAYTIVAMNARHHVTDASGQASRFAEQSSARSHLVSALTPIISHYTTVPKVSGAERSQVLNMLYELEDNTQLQDEFLVQAYELFVRSTRPGLRAHRFFKHEVMEARRRLEAARLQKQGKSTSILDRVRLPHGARPRL